MCSSLFCIIIILSNNICSPPKRGRPQVRLPIKTRGRFGPSFSSRSQRQDPGRYPSRSQQSTPKATASKTAGRNLRKTRSAPPTETRSLRLGSRSTRHSPNALQADVFVELLSPRGKRRVRKSADNTPEHSPSLTSLRVSTSRPSVQLIPLNSAERLSLQDSESKRRGRKRQSTGMTSDSYSSLSEKIDSFSLFTSCSYDTPQSGLKHTSLKRQLC